MARNSGGTYSRTKVGGYIALDEILSVEVNSEVDDIAAALTDSLSRSGKGGMQANLDMAGFSIVNELQPVGRYFPTGTRLAFAQAAAPPGWTQDATDNADNRMLRVVNTAGGGVGGSSSPILNNVIPSHTHSISGTTQNSTHYHYVTVAGAVTTAESEDISVAPESHIASEFDGVGDNRYRLRTKATGSTAQPAAGRTSEHTHNHTILFASQVNAGASNWTPRYIDLIICSKN